MVRTGIRRTGSEYIKSIVYGGVDGIITSFAVVAASVGAHLGMDILLLMGKRIQPTLGVKELDCGRVPPNNHIYLPRCHILRSLR